MTDKTQEIVKFIDEACQEMNKEYSNWKELTRIYELAANMDLSKNGLTFLVKSC